MPDSTDLQSDCQLCGGVGWVHVDEGALRLCECAKRRQNRRQIEREIPRRYWDAALTDFPGEIVAQVAAWQLEPRDGLRIVGPIGVGKTHLAAAIACGWLASGLPVLFRDYCDVDLRLRDSFARNEAEGDVLRELFDAPRVVLDDLGAKKLTEFVRDRTLQILNARNKALLPTVVTTNLSLEEISARLDDRIASRLASLAELVMSGPDRRVRKAQLMAGVLR